MDQKEFSKFIKEQLIDGSDDKFTVFLAEHINNVPELERMFVVAEENDKDIALLITELDKHKDVVNERMQDADQLSIFKALANILSSNSASCYARYVAHSVIRFIFDNLNDFNLVLVADNYIQDISASNAAKRRGDPRTHAGHPLIIDATDDIVAPLPTATDTKKSIVEKIKTHIAKCADAAIIGKDATGAPKSTRVSRLLFEQLKLMALAAMQDKKTHAISYQQLKARQFDIDEVKKQYTACVEALTEIVELPSSLQDLFYADKQIDSSLFKTIQLSSGKLNKLKEYQADFKKAATRTPAPAAPASTPPK